TPESAGERLRVVYRDGGRRWQGAGAAHRVAGPEDQQTRRSRPRRRPAHLRRPETRRGHAPDGDDQPLARPALPAAVPDGRRALLLPSGRDAAALPGLDRPLAGGASAGLATSAAPRQVAPADARQ